MAAGDGGRPLRYGRNTQAGVFRRKRSASVLSMKSKFRMHIGAWEYYSLESLLQLADLEENKSEFSLIREQLKEEYKTAALEQKNAGSIEEKLESVCRKYGMKAEFRSGTAYITTYAGSGILPIMTGLSRCTIRIRSRSKGETAI